MNDFLSSMICVDFFQKLPQAYSRYNEDSFGKKAAQITD